MTHYLLTIWQPDSEEPPPPEVVDLEQVMKDVDALKAEMREAGVWVFSGGLFPASRSTVVRVAEGRALMTDGPYIEGKEHVGGFTIVTAPDLDAALEWGRKLAAATTLPIEVRPFVGVME